RLDLRRAVCRWPTCDGQRRHEGVQWRQRAQTPGPGTGSQTRLVPRGEDGYNGGVCRIPRLRGRLMTPQTRAPSSPPSPGPPAFLGRPTLKSAVLAGTGRCLPSRVVHNDDFPPTLQTSDEWIRTRTGIRERHIAGADENSFTLSLEASRSALDAAGLAAD